MSEKPAELQSENTDRGGCGMDMEVIIEEGENDNITQDSTVGEEKSLDVVKSNGFVSDDESGKVSGGGVDGKGCGVSDTYLETDIDVCYRNAILPKYSECAIEDLTGDEEELAGVDDGNLSDISLDELLTRNHSRPATSFSDEGTTKCGEDIQITSDLQAPTPCVRSGMPLPWNPTIVLLKKKREAAQDSSQQSSAISLEKDRQFTTDSSHTSVDHQSVKKTNKKSEKEEPHLSCQDDQLEKTSQPHSSTSRQQQIVSSCGRTNLKAHSVGGERDSGTRSAVSLGDSRLLSDSRSLSDEGIEVKDKARPFSSHSGRSSSRDLAYWTPANASYHLKIYKNNPKKIDSYEPGSSSALKLETYINNFHNPPVEKPGENCKYTVGGPARNYSIRRTGVTISPITSVREQYKRVQMGGDIPFEGLRGPPPPPRIHSTNSPIDQNLIQSTSNQLKLPFLNQQQRHLSPSVSHPMTASHGSVTSQHGCLKRHSASSDCRHDTSSYRPLSPLSDMEMEQSRQRRDAANAAKKRQMERIISETKDRKVLEEAERNRLRRHSDNFGYSTKSPVALDRYNFDDLPVFSPTSPQSPTLRRQPTLRVKALYTFKPQNNRELGFKKGDTIYLFRRIDQNWLEGERHGSVGIFPSSYVEIVESRDHRTKLTAGETAKAVAKFSFEAFDSSQLSIKKGDVIQVREQVDENWFRAEFEGQSGLVPISYVEVTKNSSCDSLLLNTTSSTSCTDNSFQLGSPGTMSSSNSSILSSGLDLAIPPSSSSLQALCDEAGRICKAWVNSGKSSTGGPTEQGNGDQIFDQIYERHHQHNGDGLLDLSKVDKSFEQSEEGVNVVDRHHQMSSLHKGQSRMTSIGYNNEQPSPKSMTVGQLTSKWQATVDSGYQTEKGLHEERRRKMDDVLSPDKTVTFDTPAEVDSYSNNQLYDNKKIIESDDDELREGIKLVHDGNYYTEGYNVERRARRDENGLGIMKQLGSTGHHQRSSSEASTRLYQAEEEHGSKRSSTGHQTAGWMSIHDPETMCVLTPESRFGKNHESLSSHTAPYHVLYDYSPVNADELELQTGDLIYVTERFDDGWFVGISHRTNRFGMFPGNYVQKLRIRHVDLRGDL